ncbi:MAG: hypothetical protein ABR915_09780, partial [Thermoguttaceae bacterium]
WHEMRSMTPDQIVDLFSGITLADVHAALAHYFDHRQEIEDDFRNDDQWAERVNSTISSKISPELREKSGNRLVPGTEVRHRRTHPGVAAARVAGLCSTNRSMTTLNMTVLLP